MITAIVLIHAERNRINEVAEALADCEEVSEVYSVSGQYDLVSVIRVASNELLADFVTQKMAVMDAIVHTETMLAFRAYSRHDLDGMFGIGS